MKKAKYFAAIFLCMLVIVAANKIRHLYFTIPAGATLYKTQLPKRRTIKQYTFASGVLAVKNPIKIGSIISGTVKKIYVKENQRVKKGDLLAEIDPGTGETDFQVAYQAYMKEKSIYNYQASHIQRLNKLYKQGQYAKDSFEQAQQKMHIAHHSFKLADAKLEKEKLLLSARKITSPGAGFITTVNITIGSGVSGSDVGASDPLFEIAPDITEMEATLDVDESDIGQVKAGQHVTFSINTFPDRIMKSHIIDVGYSPKNAKDRPNSTQFYKAHIAICNNDKILRPGMSLNAKIRTAKVKNALAIKALAFQINEQHLKAVAKKLGYTCTAMSTKQKRKMKRKKAKQRIKFVWTVQNKQFTEQAIYVGITDDNFFEVTKGLCETSKIVLDVTEENKLKQLFKKRFSLW